MKTSTLILTLVAVASANLLPRADSSTTTTSPPTTTSASLSPTASCLASCAAGDVTCEAACVGAAHPNSSQASDTNSCAAKCPQGDGSTSDSDAYAQCLAACISSYFPTSQTVGPAAGGTSGLVTVNTASATGSGAAASGKGE